jgi:hypothetical protein
MSAASTATAAAGVREDAAASLWTRAAVVAGRLNRAHGDLVEIAAELVEGDLWGDGGFKSPSHWLVVRTGLSPSQAEGIVRIANRRSELTDMAAALTAGQLSVGQAAVVARHARADHQAGIAAFAANATVPQLRRALSKSVFLDPDAVDADVVDPDRADGSPTGATSGAADQSEDTAEQVIDDEEPPVDPLTALRKAESRRQQDRACAKPELSMYYDEIGRFHLHYSAPAEVGALVEQAVKEAKDALFTSAEARAAGGASGDGVAEHSGTPGNHPTTSRTGDPAGTREARGTAADHQGSDGPAMERPTHADAMAEIAARSLASVESTSRAAHYRVYIHLDTGGSWVGGGGAITPAMAARFSCDGTIQPLWETDGRPVSVGRDQRIVPARTRRLIEDRDRGCRYPGCTTTRFVEIHHLDHWSDGGPTDYHRQVSLCPFHHDAHHRGDVTITGDPTLPDGLHVTNRYGLPIRPPTATELAQPSGSAADDRDGLPYDSPAGGPMYARDVEFVPDAHQTWCRPALHLLRAD